MHLSRIALTLLTVFATAAPVYIGVSGRYPGQLPLYVLSSGYQRQLEPSFGYKIFVQHPQ